MGEIKGPKFYQQLYSVDAVHYADELASVLKSLRPPALHMLHGKNTDRLETCHCTAYRCLLTMRAEPSASLKPKERGMVSLLLLLQRHHDGRGQLQRH